MSSIGNKPVIPDKVDGPCTAVKKNIESVPESAGSEEKPDKESKESGIDGDDAVVEKDKQGKGNALK